MRDTAPLIPVQYSHWSFADDTARQLRSLERRKQAIAERARREVQAILGGVIYHALTGTKPILSPVRTPNARRPLTVQDLL